MANFDNNSTAQFSLRFFIDDEQDFIFPETTTVSCEEICQKRTKGAKRNGCYQGHNIDFYATI